MKILIQTEMLITTKKKKTMKNRELIELLKKLPQDMEVYDWNYYPVEEPIVKTIEVAEGQDLYDKTVIFFP